MLNPCTYFNILKEDNYNDDDYVQGMCVQDDADDDNAMS